MPTCAVDGEWQCQEGRELGAGWCWGSGAEPHEGLGGSGQPNHQVLLALVQEGLAEEASRERRTGVGAPVCTASEQSSVSPCFLCSIL